MTIDEALAVVLRYANSVFDPNRGLDGVDLQHAYKTLAATLGVPVDGD